MPWSLLQRDSYKWPKELKSKTYDKAAKAGKIKPVLDALDDAQRHFKSADFPYQWVTTNPVTHLNWQKHAIRFMGDTAKRILNHLKNINGEVDKALRDKEVMANPESKAALGQINKAVDVYLKLIQPGVIKKEVDELDKLFGEAREAFLAKKTGDIVADAKALTKARHAGLTEAKKLIGQANKLLGGSEKDADDEEAARDALQDARNKIEDVADALTEVGEALVRAQKDGAMAAGLSSSDYTALGRVRSMAKTFSSKGSDWSKKLDLKAMMAGHSIVAGIAANFDNVVRKMD